jgi:hypothetical protein
MDKAKKRHQMQVKESSVFIVRVHAIASRHSKCLQFAIYEYREYNSKANEKSVTYSYSCSQTVTFQPYSYLLLTVKSCGAWKIQNKIN